MSKMHIIAEQFVGPNGTAVMQYWRASSYYVDLVTAGDRRYIGASTDRGNAKLMAFRAAGLECAA